MPDPRSFVGSVDGAGRSHRLEPRQSEERDPRRLVGIPVSVEERLVLRLALVAVDSKRPLERERLSQPEPRDVGPARPVRKRKRRRGHEGERRPLAAIAVDGAQRPP